MNFPYNNKVSVTPLYIADRALHSVAFAQNGVDFSVNMLLGKSLEITVTDLTNPMPPWDRKGGTAMIRKSYSTTGRSCRVTFDVPSDTNATTASLCGEFNEWKPTTHPMKRRKDGRFSTSIPLKAGRTYRFRYFLDGERWENDQAADGYVLNGFGTEDSLLKL